VTSERPGGGDADLVELFAPADQFGSPYDPRGAEAVAQRFRRGRRRMIGAGIAGLLVLAAVATYVPVTLLAPVAAPTVTVTQPVVGAVEPAALGHPRALAAAVSITGAAAVEGAAGLDGITQIVGDDAPLPIASISKVITSLVVLSAKPLGAGENGPTLNFGTAENDTYDKYYVLGATIAPMKIGTAMSQHDTLEMVLAVSASNYADVLATWAFGSQAGFLSATRKWLAANGLTGTTIVEPTGIDARNRSTPGDLIAIGKLAMANPVVAEIVGSTSVDVANLGREANRNSALGFEGINGIKTGTLDDSGACLLFSAAIEVGADVPLTIVGVMLGGTDHFAIAEDAKSIVRNIKAGFHKIPLVAEGDDFGTYETTWGDDADIVAGESASVVAWSQVRVTATLESTPVVEAPSGTKVGSITYVVGATTVSVPLELRGGIAGPGGKWRLLHPFELMGQ
jgi:D-alanyl-D-alanine carboxypeptidase (penicillin-binding protein 5/6)